MDICLVKGNQNNAPAWYHHLSEKRSLLSFNVVAMERIRYHFRPLLPVEGEE